MKFNILAITLLVLSALLATASAGATNSKVESEQSPGKVGSTGTIGYSLPATASAVATNSKVKSKTPSHKVKFNDTVDFSDGTTIPLGRNVSGNTAQLTADNSRKDKLKEIFTGYLHSPKGKLATTNLYNMIQAKPMGRAEFMLQTLN
ncbi:hypothetical protein IWQ61_000764, partial [Dispira simplex]